MSKDRATENHDKGQEDAAERKGYNLPWNTFEVTSPLNPNTPQRQEDNQHYREGYEHGKSQRNK